MTLRNDIETSELPEMDVKRTGSGDAEALDHGTAHAVREAPPLIFGSSAKFVG
jgi:hypothetical protein